MTLDKHWKVTRAVVMAIDELVRKGDKLTFTRIEQLSMQYGKNIKVTEDEVHLVLSTPLSKLVLMK